MLNTRGAVLIRLGRFRDGLKMLARTGAFQFDPVERANSHAFRAMALARLGRTRAAARQLRRATQADPACRLLAEAKAELNSPTPPAADPPGETRSPAEAALELAQATRSWRAWARALMMALIVAMLVRFDTTGLPGPLLLATALFIYPERSGVYALGGSLLALSLAQLLSLGHPAGAASPLAAVVALGAATACGALAWWRRHLDAPSRTARWLLAVVVIGQAALVSYPLLHHLLHCPWFNHIQNFFLDFLTLSPLLVAFASLLFAARRRWIALAGLVPATMAVFLLVFSYGLPNP